MKKYTKTDQRLLAIWAADCAKRVLPYFEKVYPKDDRPRKAIKACRKWVRTGVFSMAEIRHASLSAHAAARKAKKNDTACFSARSAGQAVATAHVPQHAFGAAYYALKVISAADPGRITKELDRQSLCLPKHLKQDWKDFQSQRLPKNFKKLIST